MRKEIPAPIIAVLAKYFPEIETHASLDNLFLHADAPANPPEGSKPAKTQAWLRRINKESDKPLQILGKLVECHIELSPEDEEDFFGNPIVNPRLKFKKKILSALDRCNLAYLTGGIVSDGSSTPSRSLADSIKSREIPTIDAEFSRALDNVSSNPREAVSAAWNILESVFKVYIEDENLTMPQKQDLSGVWRVVREHLGFTPRNLADNDLKKSLLEYCL